MITGGTVPAALDGVRSTSLENARAPGPEGKQTSIVPETVSNFAAESPPSAPEAVPSTSPDVIPKTASGPTAPTKPEALPASDLHKTPYPVLEVKASEDPKNVPKFEATQFASHEAAFGTDPEKLSTSTIPAPDGKETPVSSGLEKDIDLEAGHRSEESDKQEPETSKPEADSNIIDWEGPDDPKNPINWSEKLKWANVAVIASITFLT